MNSDLGFNGDRDRPNASKDGDRLFADRPCDTAKSLDVLQRDRFETISAYLDGEVDAEERQQVERWLATDPSAQCLYQRLLKLRQGLQGLQATIPANLSSQKVTQEITERVFQQLDRKPKFATLWGTGAAAAALLVAMLSTGLLAPTSQLPQQAQAPIQSPVPVTDETPVVLALDSPVIEALQSADAKADEAEMKQ